MAPMQPAVTLLEHIRQFVSEEILSRAAKERKLSPNARRVLTLAREEAGRLNHRFIGTEHILLGILKLGECSATHIFQNIGIEPDDLRRRIERAVPPGPEQKITGHIPYTPHAKKAIAQAAKEARTVDHNCVSTEDLMAGMLREKHCKAAGILAAAGLGFRVV